MTATLAKLDDGIALKQLNVTSPNMNVSAHGEWRGKDAGISRIQGTLTSTDVQSTLKDLGYADVIQAKSGKVEFDLNWVGAPTAEALAQVAGHVQLSLDKGQVTGLKPGAGRVLGLASIAALPRRLALDFSDLTDKGLAFDTVRGDFDLRDGNAYTENVLLKGPAGGNRPDRARRLEKQGLRPNCGGNRQRRKLAVDSASPAPWWAARWWGPLCCCSRRCSNSR